LIKFNEKDDKIKEYKNKIKKFYKLKLEFSSALDSILLRNIDNDILMLKKDQNDKLLI